MKTSRVSRFQQPEDPSAKEEILNRNTPLYAELIRQVLPDKNMRLFITVVLFSTAMATYADFKSCGKNCDNKCSDGEEIGQCGYEIALCLTVSNNHRIFMVIKQNG
jgi:hypothetical protein